MNRETLEKIITEAGITPTSIAAANIRMATTEREARELARLYKPDERPEAEEKKLDRHNRRA